MTFTLSIVPINNNVGNIKQIRLETGKVLFILGANGTGKSSLLLQFYRENRDNARRLAPHRQTSVPFDIEMSPQARRQLEVNMQSKDAGPSARYMDAYSSERTGMVIYNLVNAERVRERSIGRAVDSDDPLKLDELRKALTPIQIINGVFRHLNLAIEIKIENDLLVVPGKYEGYPYNIPELSDGERNALLLTAEVVTAEPGSLILIDEPELHMHPSLISPLLAHLFELRSDCAFAISTHDLTIPVGHPDASILLVRDCLYYPDGSLGFDVDEIATGDADIPEDIKSDILGARRSILFVEGNEGSLDKRLYSLIFPGVSVVCKDGCREVSRAVIGIRAADNLHWLHAFGVVDNDSRSEEDINKLEANYIYPLSVFSIESIYYHPEMQQRCVEAHLGLNGKDLALLLANAKDAAIEAFKLRSEHLVTRIVEKQLREEMFRNMPKQKDIRGQGFISVVIDVQTKVSHETSIFESALNSSDLSLLMVHYPIRETPALNNIAKALGFQDQKQYECAVLNLIRKDQQALSFAKTFVADLIQAMAE